MNPIKTYVNEPVVQRVRMKPTEENPLAPPPPPAAAAATTTTPAKPSNNNEQQPSSSSSSPVVVTETVISEENQVATEYITFFRGRVPSSKISQINPLSLPVNEESLEQLGQLRLWNHALSMAEKAQSQHYKLAALIKLAKYDEADELLRQLTEKERTFSIRLLEMTLMHLRGDTDTAIERLFDELQDHDLPLPERKRATLQLVALYQERQEYDVCISLLVSLIEALADDSQVVTYLGRILLQEGNVSAAQAIFSSVPGEPLSTVHSALVLVAHSRFREAFEALSPLVQRINDPQQQNEEAYSLDMCMSIVNNYAMAALYANEIKAAVDALETFISRDPIRHTQETLIFNLSTLYELSSTRPHVKKLVLRRIIREFGADDFDYSCLRA